MHTIPRSWSHNLLKLKLPSAIEHYRPRFFHSHQVIMSQSNGTPSADLNAARLNLFKSVQLDVITPTQAADNEASRKRISRTFTCVYFRNLIEGLTKLMRLFQRTLSQVSTADKGCIRSQWRYLIIISAHTRNASICNPGIYWRWCLWWFHN